MKSFFKFVAARVSEPSTYAGISALALAVGQALQSSNHVTAAVAVGTAVAGAGVAILKADGATKAAADVQRVVSVVQVAAPVLEPVVAAALAAAVTK